jgi:hypothetical protein
MAEQLSTCALCGGPGPLRQSHVVPRFVIRHIQSESLTGYLRAIERPDVRLQDAFKTQLLCGLCEQRFSAWESTIAKSVFPLLKSAPDSEISYDADFSRFAVSVLWRVLVWRVEQFIAISPEFARQAKSVEREWRQFLLATAKTPGRGSCHALTLGEKLMVGIGDSASPTSERFQRYLENTVDVNVTFDGQSVLVYAKLHRLLLFGFVHNTNSAGSYRSSRIGLRRGALGPGEYQIPAGVFAACFENAKKVFSIIDSVSSRQRTKIDESIAAALRNRPVDT